MKIAVAQTKPVKGDIAANMVYHKALIGLAFAAGAEAIFFPELSITGYEPALAEQLAVDPGDAMLNDFQQISDDKKMIIAVGMPTRSANGLHITQLIFQPGLPLQAYSKQHVHADEAPYFINGRQQIFLQTGQHTIAPAICYELSVPSHSQFAHQQGADIYVASVAKTAAGVEKAYAQLSDIARQYNMTVLMSNCVGHCDNFLSVGQSAIWNNQGELMAQLDATEEGILIVDTISGQISQQYI